MRLLVRFRRFRDLGSQPTVNRKRHNAGAAAADKEINKSIVLLNQFNLTSTKNIQKQFNLTLSIIHVFHSTNLTNKVKITAIICLLFICLGFLFVYEKYGYLNTSMLFKRI